MKGTTRGKEPRDAFGGRESTASKTARWLIFMEKDPAVLSRSHLLTSRG
jgi:hypothetical protein